ncbi:hypothetical protein A0H81_00187 [Grifola frondosa]|uniref:Uncharacterized protein n=1 Tax=Grifola frondosa TaxID=5627 RepID=A0A1C7MTD5_GRIFR|nr:hypothetical protein A0H81_00187 [Grifola frondosa]
MTRPCRPPLRRRALWPQLIHIPGSDMNGHRLRLVFNFDTSTNRSYLQKLVLVAEGRCPFNDEAGHRRAHNDRAQA